MTHRTWLAHPAVIWLCLIVFPPLGLLLLWMKRDSRLAGRLLLSLMAIVFTVLHLYLFWGFRVEPDGGVINPFFVFRNRERHSREIERLHREEHSTDASRMEAPLQAEPVSSPATSEVRRKPELPAPASSTYWTEFRGPARRGIYSEREIITDWPEAGLQVIWKRPVGGGYASVVVANETVFTIEQRRQKEVVTAYDLESGREKWIHGWDAEFRETLGGDGPRATPAWHEGRLYALGATGEFRCLDAQSGKRIWSRNILVENQAENLQWGMAASPLIVDDKVIVLPGGSGGKSVVAYNKLTGKPVWQSLDDRQAYASPQLATLAGRRQLLIACATRVVGVSVEDGSLLWEYPWAPYNGISAAQPIVISDNRFFISAGYDHGAALVEITASGNSFEAGTVWRNKRMKNRFGSSVLHDGYIYGFDDGILACVDAATGELKWKGGRYGYGQLLLASGYLIVTSETGEIMLLKASPEKHEEIARFQALEGKTWNVPALADGKLIVRNQTEMACFRIGR